MHTHTRTFNMCDLENKLKQFQALCCWFKTRSSMFNVAYICLSSSKPKKNHRSDSAHSHYIFHKLDYIFRRSRLL